MKIYEEFKNSFFNNEGKKLNYRYQSSKMVFVVVTLLFFLNYYIASFGYKPEIFLQYLPITYSIFLVSFGAFMFFAINKFFKGEILKYVSFGAIIVIIVLGIMVIFLPTGI